MNELSLRDRKKKVDLDLTHLKEGFIKEAQVHHLFSVSQFFVEFGTKAGRLREEAGEAGSFIACLEAGASFASLLTSFVCSTPGGLSQLQRVGWTTKGSNSYRHCIAF